MTIRISFCGPNTKLNRILVNETQKLLSEFEPVVMRHPIEELLEFTRDEEWTNEIDWLTLNTNVWRQMAQIRYQNETVLISPSCGIDNVASTATWLAEQARLIEKSGSLLRSDGKQMIRKEHILFNRTGSILQVILNQAEQEAVEYWDFMYAVLPTVSKLETFNDEMLTQYQDFLSSVPAFDKVELLPDNEASAIDVLRTEVDKWKNYHNLSS